MGLFSDLIRDSRIREAKESADTLEKRFTRLEEDVRKLEKTLNEALRRLENHLGQDLNADGRVG